MIRADPGWCDLQGKLINSDTTDQLAPLQPEFISISSEIHRYLQPLYMCSPVSLYSWLCYCLCLSHYHFCSVAPFVLFVWLKECTRLLLRLSFWSLCRLSSVSCYAGPDPWSCCNGISVLVAQWVLSVLCTLTPNYEILQRLIVFMSSAVEQVLPLPLSLACFVIPFLSLSCHAMSCHDMLSFSIYSSLCFSMYLSLS